MTTDELTMLLARIQVLDNRQVDQLTIEAWWPLMEDLDYQDAVDAVNTHFRESAAYLHPAHVRAGVKRTRGVSQPPPFRELPRSGRIAPKPVNFDAMVAACQSGDRAAIDREFRLYDQQCAKAAYDAQVTP